MMLMDDQVITNPPTKHKQNLKRFWLSTRDRLLGQIDDIERALGIEPRTSQIRAWYREALKKDKIS